MEEEHRLKAQVKVWQGKRADIKKEMVSRTKGKGREAKELQKAEVVLLWVFTGGKNHPPQCGVLHSACFKSLVWSLDGAVWCWWCTLNGFISCLCVSTLRSTGVTSWSSLQSARWRVADTLKSKQNLLEAAYVVTRLKGFSSAYELVKSEKNKIVTLIQHAILRNAGLSCTTCVRTYSTSAKEHSLGSQSTSP